MFRATCNSFCLPCKSFRLDVSVFRAACNSFRLPCKSFRLDISVFRAACNSFRLPCKSFRLDVSMFRAACNGFCLDVSVFRAACNSFCLPCSNFCLDVSVFRAACNGFCLDIFGLSLVRISLRRLGSHCVGRLCRLVRAASPLGRSKWRLRNETQYFRRVCWVTLKFYPTYNFLRETNPYFIFSKVTFAFITRSYIFPVSSLHIRYNQACLELIFRLVIE